MVPFPIACGACFCVPGQLYSLLREHQPERRTGREVLRPPAAGIFGYSHLTGGFAGGQAQYVRVPFADVGPLKVERTWPTSRCCSCPTSCPTGYMGAEMCDINPVTSVAVWGCGPVGQFAMDSARLLGAETRHRHRPVPYRLQMAAEQG